MTRSQRNLERGITCALLLATLFSVLLFCVTSPLPAARRDSRRVSQPRKLLSGSHSNYDGLVFATEAQRLLINDIYGKHKAQADADLASLEPSAFNTSIILRDKLGWPRKYIWDFFPPAFNCPLEERVGNHPRDGDGGKWVCGVQTLLQHDRCVVYSFGSDGETAFEEGLIADTPCECHVFDPTLSLEQTLKVQSVPGLTFHKYGLGTFDGMLCVDSQSTMRRGVPAFPVKTLRTIMQELGHSWIDVLKMDIEGSEWGVLDQLLLERKLLPFTQLQVEFHWWSQSNLTVPKQMLGVLQQLTGEGQMRPFHVEPNTWWVNNGHDFMELAFLQINSGGHIVGGLPQ